MRKDSTGKQGTPQSSSNLRKALTGGDTSMDQGSVTNKEDRWNKCQYLCSICNWTSIDSRQMRSHIATNHEMSYDQYVQQYGSAEVVTKRFTCGLCMSVMKHCRQNIYAHMKDVHKISLAEYEEQMGMAGISTEDQDQQDSIVIPAVAPVTGRREIPILPKPAPAPYLPIPVTISGSGSKAVIPNLLDNGNVPSRWNRCRFKCAICHKLSSEKRHIREQVVKMHALSMQDYEAQYGDCEIHTEVRS